MPHRAAIGRIRRLPKLVFGKPHGFLVPEHIPPCSYIDQLLSDDLLSSGADTVHTLHPCHWVAGFQGLRDPLGVFHLVADSFPPVLRLLVQSWECSGLLYGYAACS